jgi:predicted amidophosphoribosyltransferase
LVDDTFTTGSSLNAAAEALIKKARVAEVVPLTLAYTSRRSA